MSIIKDFPFCAGTYAGASTTAGVNNLGMSTVFDQERCVNFYPEPATPQGHPKSKAELVGRPGLSLFTTLPAFPVRALWAGNNRLFAVAGKHFYEVNQNGTVRTDYGAMAGSFGTGPAQIISNGNQLLVMDSSVLSTGQLPGQIFNANPVTFTMDPVFQGSSFTYLDGFYFAISCQPNDNNKVFQSNLLDGTTWNGLSFVQRTGAPDLLLQLEVLNSNLWMFGEKSIEIWYDAGNATFSLVRIQGATISMGLVARWSLVKYFNTMLWIGGDDRGYPAVYMADGLSPKRISNPGVEYLLGNYAANFILAATAYGYTEAGHTFYCINLPGAINWNGQNGMALCYDLSTGLWHERTYWNGTDVSLPRPACCAALAAFGFTGGLGDVGNFTFVGDYQNGNIYLQSLTNPSDAGQPIKYIRRAPVIADGNRWIKYKSLEVDADVGSAQAVLSYSNNYGKTFAHSRAAIPASAPQGNVDQFPRFKWWQLGRSRSRVFQVSITDSVNRIRLVDAYADAKAGTEK